MRADSLPRIADASFSRDGSAESLSAAIEDSARRLTFGTLLCRLVYLVAAVILFPLLVVIGDHLLPGGLPRAVIFGAGILWGLATILTVMGVSLRTVLRRLNRVFVARHVERSRGIRHNPLVNMVLLERSPQADYAHDGAVRQAVSVLETAGPEAPGATLSLRQPGLLLLAAVGFWVLYTAIAPKPILPSLARLFGAGCDAPTATRLDLVRPRPDQPVYVGEPLEIEFAVSGHSVAAVWFELLNPAASDAPPLLRSALRRGEDSDAADRYRISLAAHEVSADLHYRCSAGDAAVAGVIAVQPRPDLLEWRIELVPPAYVEEPTQQTSEPELRVWSGTRATFVARANTDVHDPIFVFRGETETRTRMSVDPTRPHRAELSLRLTRSGEYWLEFSDRWGRGCCDPPRHRIVVRQDLAPRVEITTPSREETPSGVVDVTHTAWLRAVAADDVRLDALFLVRDVGGELSRTSLLDSQSYVRGRSIELGVATSDLSLEVGESLPVWFEARDNRVLLDGTPAPQITTSRELILIRLPDAIPEELGDEVTAADLADLADSTGTRERTVKRLRGSDGGEGEPADAANEAGERQGGPDSSSGKYRRAPDGGADDDAADNDQQPPGMLDPEQMIEADGGDEAPQEAAEDDGAAGQQREAANEFNDELRRFGQQHGEEAREVNRRRSGRPEDAESDEAQSGQGESGGGAENNSPQRDLQSDSQAKPMSDEGGGVQPDNVAEPEEPKPESQPSQPEQAERDRPEQQTEPAQPPDNEQPTREESEQQRDSGGDKTRPQEPRQPETAPTPDKEDGQQAGQPEKKDEASAPEQTGSGADAEESGESQEQAEPRQATQPEQQPAQEPGAEQGQQGARDDAEQQSQAADQPGSKPGEQVIPMPGKRSAPEVQPPSAPAASPAGAADEPADSSERSDLMDTLDLLQRGAEVSEDDLIELGWPPAKRSAFVRDFERLREAARRAGVLSQLRWWRTRVSLGSADVTAGTGLSKEVSVGVAGGPSVRDGLEQIAPPPEQRIAPELRALLDAYYRSLAEERAQQRDGEVANSP